MSESPGLSHFTGCPVNVLLNPNVAKIVDKAAVDLAADDSIDSFQLLQGEEALAELVNIPRDELDCLRYDPDILLAQQPHKTNRPKKTWLTIHTPVLEGNAMWKFTLNGRPIDATIDDDNFKMEVAKGNERFAAGDTLQVDLEVTERMDWQLATYVPSSYRIAKVHKHLKMQEQLKLNYDKRSSAAKRSTKKKTTKKTTRGKQKRKPHK